MIHANIEIIFFYIGILLLAGIISGRMSNRLNLPILLAFLGVGIFVQCVGWLPESFKINPQSHTVNAGINLLGTVAMCFILFAGGINTKFKSIRPVLVPGLLLATIGVILTAVLLGVSLVLVMMLFGQQPDYKLALLFGCIISSTDAAAVFAILRGGGISLKNSPCCPLQPLLELESGSNDPAAFLLTVFMLEIIKAGNIGIASTLLKLSFDIVIGLGGGIVLGIILGFLGVYIYNFCSKHRIIEQEGLYFVVIISLIIMTYGLAQTIKLNGLMAVYTCGIVMGNIKFTYNKGITHFTDGLSWLMQVCLFTALGLFVNPKELINIYTIGFGLLVSLLLVFVARPLAVWITLAGSKLSTREKTLISWVGLRGASPIMLATFPLVAGIAQANTIFNLIFFMVIVSLVLQGLTLMPLAKKLGLSNPCNAKAPSPLELEMTAVDDQRLLYEFEVTNLSPVCGCMVKNLDKWPKGCMIMLKRRNGKFSTVGGNDILLQGDGIIVVGDTENIEKIHQTFFPDNEFSTNMTLENALNSARKNIFGINNDSEKESKV